MKPKNQTLAINFCILYFCIDFQRHTIRIVDPFQLWSSSDHQDYYDQARVADLIRRNAIFYQRQKLCETVFSSSILLSFSIFSCYMVCPPMFFIQSSRLSISAAMALELVLFVDEYQLRDGCQWNFCDKHKGLGRLPKPLWMMMVWKGARGGVGNFPQKNTDNQYTIDALS